MLLGTTTSKAALQANPTTHKSPVTKTGETWLTQIRQMETTGQTMGLDETLNELNATEENGIDVHMMLPTEYGAVAILSASGYGNPDKLTDEVDEQKRTTTGNSTGVYYTTVDYEVLAGTDRVAESKYVQGDNLFQSVQAKFYGWHGACKDELICGTTGTQWHPMVVIGGHDSIFTLTRVRSAIYGSDTCNAWDGVENGTGPNRPRGKFVLWKSRGTAVMLD